MFRCVKCRLVIKLMVLQELPAKAVMAVVSGRPSTGPKDVLFVKWRENWNSLMAEMNEGDELNTFDWEAAEGSAQETVARGVRDWAIYVKEHNHFGKGDYTSCLNLVLLYLGHHVPCKIPRPCNVSFSSFNIDFSFLNPQISRARFLQVGIYYLMMFLLLETDKARSLLSAQERVEIKKMAPYVALHYLPWMLSDKYTNRYTGLIANHYISIM